MVADISQLAGYLNEPYRINEVLEAARKLPEPFTLREVVQATRLSKAIVHERLTRALKKGILTRQKGPVTAHGTVPKPTYIYTFVAGR